LVFTVATPDATAAIPTIEGGVAVVALDGTLSVFGPDGGPQTATIATGSPNSYIIAIDPSGQRLAVASDDDVVAMVELKSGLVETVGRSGPISNLGFAPGGDLLAITQLDGTIRLWDSGIQAFVTTVTAATTRTPDGEPGWYDETTSSLWTTTGDRLIAIPLGPEVWAAQACELIGRDLTNQEWDLYVPGGRPQSPVCP
jgi:WD40 repeat protein